MPLFRCIICGENFPGTLLGQEELVGFYTTRFVEADSPEQAEIMAIELLRNDPSLDVSSANRTQSAKVFFEDIDEVPGDTEQKTNKIGRAHVCTQVTNAHIVCRLLLEKNKHQ